MATPNEKLAASLSSLRALQKNGRRVFRSSELRRGDRARLLEQGFVHEVIKGWLMSTSPSTKPADTTPWYASFWEFCARYCDERFGKDWNLSPEQSLLLHAEHALIPAQVVIYSPKGTNNTINLPFGTSLYDLKQRDMPADPDLTEKDGLRLFMPAAALLRVPESFYARFPIEAQVILTAIKDSSEILGRLLEGGHSVVAGRLAAAFRRIGRAYAAEEIVKAMKGAGYDVRETDPFNAAQPFGRLNLGTCYSRARSRPMGIGSGGRRCIVSESSGPSGRHGRLS